MLLPLNAPLPSFPRLLSVGVQGDSMRRADVSLLGLKTDCAASRGLACLIFLRFLRFLRSLLSSSFSFLLSSLPFSSLFFSCLLFSVPFFLLLSSVFFCLLFPLLFLFPCLFLVSLAHHCVTCTVTCRPHPLASSVSTLPPPTSTPVCLPKRPNWQRLRLALSQKSTQHSALLL